MEKASEEIEPREKHQLISWLGGCFTGCLLGAVGGPVAFVLLMLMLSYLAPGSDAEGALFWMVLSVPCGAIVGAIAFSIGRELSGSSRARSNGSAVGTKQNELL